MKDTMKRMGWLYGVALAAAGAMRIATAEAAELVPHRALYEMHLSYADSIGASVSDARGAMTYEFHDSCDGWTMSTKVYLRLQRGDGPELESVRTMTAWESKDGLSFRFRVHETQGGAEVQEIKGVAALEAPGKPGVAEFTSPKTVTVKLPAGTIFPTAHLAAMIAARNAKKSYLGKVVFDGTSLENPYEVSVLFNARPHPTKYGDAVAAKLKDLPIASARLAYFPFYKDEEFPAFEQVMDYRDDGIVTRLLQDFGDYGIVARIQRLEMLPLDKC